jgi:hypothetical protein
MTEHNQGIIVTGGTFTAQQVAVGPHATVVQQAAAGPPPIDEDQVAAANMGLVRALIAHFSLDELRLLCAGLGVDYEALNGDTKPARALDLMLTCARRGRLAELAAAIREERPGTEV